MHKSIDFKKEKINNKKKNIIFLDIDGVIQPYNNQYRFKYDMKETVKFLAKKFNDEIYNNIDIYDLCAAYYDWDEIALGILKKIIFLCDAYIVIHSGWKESLSLLELKALFRLYNLDEYILDVCDKGDKKRVIKDYLNKNSEMINEYIILEDMDLINEFGYHFIQTRDRLNLNDYIQALKIFTNKYKFELVDKTLTCLKNDNKIFETNFIIKDINNEKISFSKLTSFDNYLREFDYKIFINELIFQLKNINSNILISYVLSQDKIFKESFQNSFLSNNFYIESFHINNLGFKSYEFCNKNKKLIENSYSEFIKSL